MCALGAAAGLGPNATPLIVGDRIFTGLPVSRAA